MKGTKDITLEIGVPNFFYSDGSTIANLVSSNIIMVKHLNLCKGGFTLNDDDMKLLADSLLNNTYLTLIDLDGSDITKVGHMAILGALFNVSSLNACVTSNHSCRLKLGRNSHNISDDSNSDIDYENLMNGNPTIRSIFSF